MCHGGARPLTVCPRCVGRASAHVRPRARTPLRLRLKGLQSMLGPAGSILYAGISCDTRRNRPNFCLCLRRDSLESPQNASVPVSKTLRVWWAPLLHVVFRSCPRAPASFERYPPPSLLRRTFRSALVRAASHASRMLVEYSLLYSLLYARLLVKRSTSRVVSVRCVLCRVESVLLRPCFIYRFARIVYTNCTEQFAYTVAKPTPAVYSLPYIIH